LGVETPSDQIPVALSVSSIGSDTWNLIVVDGHSCLLRRSFRKKLTLLFYTKSLA
jgi:hypothetical protein